MQFRVFFKKQDKLGSFLVSAESHEEVRQEIERELSKRNAKYSHQEFISY